MGWAQDMNTIVSSAFCLRDHKNILFLLVGDGVEKRKAQTRSQELGLESILWLPMQPSLVYPEILAASDVSLINLHPELHTPVVPSKLLSIMAAARPVVASLPDESDAGRIINEANCGICVKAGDGEALAQAILKLGARAGERDGVAGQGVCRGSFLPGGMHRASRICFEKTGRGRLMKNYRELFRDKVVLVTGGAGAIGSNLTRALAEGGARVVVFDDLSSAERWNVPSLPNVMFVEGDILDEVKLKRVFFERPHMVYHLAAFFANQNSVDHPERDLMVNGMGTLRLLEYSVFTGVERFIYASSGCSIYGSSAPLPLEEDFVSLHLSSPYQITKMLGELYCNFFTNHWGIRVVKPRFQLLGQAKCRAYRNVIPNFIYWAMKGNRSPSPEQEEETRDFTTLETFVMDSYGQGS
jgi:hypothetical protein